MTSSVPGPVSCASVEEQAWLGQRRCPVAGAADCRTWLDNPGRVRFRRQRWVPRRLLYSLQGPSFAEALDGQRLRPVCGTADCIEPGHQKLVGRAPPVPVKGTGAGKRRGKRKRAADADLAARQASVMAQVRAELWKLQATLARIDAAGAAVPPELRGTEAHFDAEQAALRDPDADPSEPLPTDRVWVDAPTAPMALDRAQAIEADPFGFVMGRI